MSKYEHDIVVEGRLQDPEIEERVLGFKSQVTGLMATATGEGLRLRFSCRKESEEVRALLTGAGFVLPRNYIFAEALTDDLTVDSEKLRFVRSDLLDILDAFASAEVVVGAWSEFFELAVPDVMRFLIDSYLEPPTLRKNDFMQQVIDEMFWNLSSLEESFNADPVIRKIFEGIFMKNLAIVFP